MSLSGKQKTLKASFQIKGKGLHLGMETEVEVKPAPENTGILFRRSDIKGSSWNRATYENINSDNNLGRQTSLGAAKASISTIEHLMAAFYGLGVDNAMVEVSGPELPGLDGSAEQYCQAIEGVGLEDQAASREVYKIVSPISVDFKDASLVILPADEFKVSYTLSYGNQHLGDQFFRTVVTEEVFRKEIAPARTFVLKHEAEALMAKGYGKGADFENTLVFEENRPMNNELRFSTEAARHKTLDLIGDLALLGQRIQGHVIANRTGHHHNLELVKALAERVVGKASAVGDDKSHLTDKDLDINQIKKILPHRYPFLFVDKITITEETKKAVGIKNVTLNDYFFQGHFPGHPIMPGVIMVEAMAQAAGVVLLRIPENTGKLAYFMSMDNVKFRRPVVPGDQLRLEIEVLKRKSKISECQGKTYVDDKVVCEALLRFAIVDG